MPRRDGTGLIGARSVTGRGLGPCTGVDAESYEAGYGRGFGRGQGFGRGSGYGRGLGCRRGFGRAFAVNQTPSKTQKDLLLEQKTILQNQLEAIDEQLEQL